ncbi:hypothetical protein H2199_005613 [Coniosporium tulheliwenetii]|uniref:Uncharacterized protein n=1 Tax=Coniosporium tulheliwenetii TaxID=3383036 RepID=A0ACC2Z051_9PEZI|nr:hypothetical protein H2199_005613 [Cladosporium sp. JES 115]
MKPSLFRYSFLAEDLPVAPSMTSYERTRLPGDPESNYGQIRDETPQKGLGTSGLDALATAAEIDRAETILFEAGRDAWYDSSSRASTPEYESTDEANVAAPGKIPDYCVDRASLDVLCAAARHVEAGGEANTEVQVQDEAEIETEVGSEAEMDVDAGFEVGLDTEAESEAEPELDTKLDAGLDVGDNTEADTEVEVEADEDDDDDPNHFRFVVGRFTEDKDGNPIDQVALLTLRCIDKNGNLRIHSLKSPQNWDDKKEILKLNRHKNQYLQEIQAWQEDEREHLKSLYLANDQITVAQAMKSLNKFNKGKTWNSGVKGQDLPRKERTVASVHSEWIRKNGAIENLKKELALQDEQGTEPTEEVEEEGQEEKQQQEQSQEEESTDKEHSGEDNQDLTHDNDEIMDVDGPAPQNPTGAASGSQKRKRKALEDVDDDEADNEEERAEPPTKRRKAPARTLKTARSNEGGSTTTLPVNNAGNTVLNRLRKRKQM